MSVACKNSNFPSQECCVLVTLRAWLNTVAPLTIAELNAKVRTLGRPAKNLIAKYGGILEVLKQCPGLIVTNDKVEVSFGPASVNPVKLDSRDVSARLNRSTATEIHTLNRNLTKLHIGPRSGSLVGALQKREKLAELERQCGIKRLEIENLKERIREKIPEDSHQANDRLEELEAVRVAALQRLAVKEASIQYKVTLEKLLIKLDKEIESREDKLERLKLKILYNQEKLAMFEQDLFFESRQHESLTHELLEQHSSDLKKLTSVFEVLVREKCNHSKAVLEAHARALETSNQGESRASQSCRKRIAEIEQKEEELLHRIGEHRINLQMISQLDMITLDSIQSPLFREKVTEAACVEETIPKDSTPGEERRATVCAICLTDLSSRPTESLECSHDFHSSCLAEMYSSGTSHCPLCRRYEPSSLDFPTL